VTSSPVRANSVREGILKGMSSSGELLDFTGWRREQQEPDAQTVKIYIIQGGKYKMYQVKGYRKI
jgi:hypothetical protein